jgi:hypothetical protein
MQGMALLNVLVAVSVLGIVFAAALPAALSLYARVAVEYEAVRLVAEIRRVQAISRVTAMELYMLEGRRSWKRDPRLEIYTDGYALHRPFDGTVRVHEPLPLVRFEQETAHGKRVAFDRNGDIARDWSSNMTIRVYAVGYEQDALRVVIDQAARIRLHRGASHVDEEE